MKVVLLESMEGLGTVGQEVKVKDGYARNFLIPKGLALMASDKNIKAFKDKIQEKVKSEAKSKEHAEKFAAELQAVNLKFAVKTGQEGKLFGSVTSQNVFDALQEKGFEIDKKKILLTDSIRHVGVHEVSVRLFPGVTAMVKVEVVPESGE
jgi:large subunit ribosomal protein L9